MLELQQIGEAERHWGGTMGAGQQGQFTVGGGEHNDIGRRLYQVDGFGGAINHARNGGEKMH